MERELAEECLLVDENRQISCFRYNGKPLVPGFDKRFLNLVFPEEFSANTIPVSKGRFFFPETEKIDYIEGEPVGREMRVHIQGNYGAIQVGVSGHVPLDIVSEVISSEQGRNEQKLLEDRISFDRVVMIRLGDNYELTREVVDGKFNPINPYRILLPQDFDLGKRGYAPEEKRVIPVDNGMEIPLEEFLNMQRKA